MRRTLTILVLNESQRWTELAWDAEKMTGEAASHRLSSVNVTHLSYQCLSSSWVFYKKKFKGQNECMNNMSRGKQLLPLVYGMSSPRVCESSLVACVQKPPQDISVSPLILVRLYFFLS